MAQVTLKCILVSMLTVLTTALPQQVAVPAMNPVPVAGQVANAPVANPAVVAGQVANTPVANPAVVAGQVANTPVANPAVVAGQVANAPVANPAVVAGQVANAPVASPAVVAGQVANAPAANPAVVAGQVANAPVANPAAVAGQATNAPVAGQTAVASSNPVVNPSPVSSAGNVLNNDLADDNTISTKPCIEVIKDSIIKIRNATLDSIRNLMKQKKSFSLAISDGSCNSVQNYLGAMIKKSFKSMVPQLITYQQQKLANVQISELPEYSESFPTSKANVSSLKLKNIVIKGLESLTLSKLELDICAMSFESELSVPNLSLTADYTLDGTVESSPVKGAGSVSVVIDTFYVYDQSFMDCNTIIFSEEVCKFSNKNKTVDINMNSVKVNITGIKYKNLNEAQINEGVNYFITDYIKSNKLGLVQKITDLMTRFKDQMLDEYSPMKLLNKIKNDLYSLLPQLLDEKPMLKEGDFLQNVFTLFV